MVVAGDDEGFFLYKTANVTITLQSLSDRTCYQYLIFLENQIPITIYAESHGLDLRLAHCDL